MEFVVSENQINTAKQKLRTHTHAHTCTHSHTRTYTHALILNDDIMDVNDLSGISIIKVDKASCSICTLTKHAAINVDTFSQSPLTNFEATPL